MSLTARGYVQPLTTEHCGSVHYITIGDSRLLTAADLTRSPLYLIGDAASRCGLSRVGYFIPLNGRRRLNGHPPSGILYNTNFSRGGNFRYIRELGFCAKFSSRENNIHCEWNFAKFSSREIFLPRNFPPRENKILIAV